MKILLFASLSTCVLAWIQSTAVIPEYWLGQGVSVAILAAVGGFFAWQIWPAVKVFFSSLLEKQDKQHQAIVDLKAEYITTSLVTSSAAAAAQTAASAASTAATAAAAATAALLEKMDEQRTSMLDVKMEIKAMREDSQRQNELTRVATERNSDVALKLYTSYSEYINLLKKRLKHMPCISFDEVMAILAQWEGTAEEKLTKWQETYNFIIPPPPPPPPNDRELAWYIVGSYDGPNPPEPQLQN